MSVQQRLHFTAQQKALAIIPKFSSALSLVGSISIVVDMLRDRRRWRKTYHRLIFGFGATGNDRTCIILGVVTQAFALCTPLYNATLCVFYCLVFLNGWTDQRVFCMEPLFHLIPVLLGLGTALVGIPLDLYHPAAHVCWIVPSGCDEIGNNCSRGEDAWIYQWALLYGPAWTAFVCITLCLHLLYRHVRQLEARISSLETEHEMGDDQRSNKCSRAIAIQALWYIGAFYLSWFPKTVARVWGTVVGGIPFPLDVIKAVLFPVQGLWNAMIYQRPYYATWKRMQQLPSNLLLVKETESCWAVVYPTVYWIENLCDSCCVLWCNSTRTGAGQSRSFAGRSNSHGLSPPINSSEEEETGESRTESTLENMFS